MLLAVQLVTLALRAASCPSNLANDLAAPAPAASRQLEPDALPQIAIGATSSLRQARSG